MAKSRKKQGVLLDSASTAELKATVQATDINAILRGIAQETAGVAFEKTVEAELPGSGPPSSVGTQARAPGLNEMMVSPPSELVSDSNSPCKRLCNCARHDQGQGSVSQDVAVQ